MRVLRRWCGTVSLRARAANQHPNFSELPPYIAQDQAKDMHRPLPSAPAGRQPLATVYPENDITPINSGSQPPAGFETYRAVPESHHEPNVFKPPSPTIHAQLASNASPPRRNSSVPPPQVPQAQTHTPFLPPQPSSQEHFKNYPQQPQRGVMAPGSPRMMPPQQVPSNYQGGNQGANEGRRPAVSQMRTQQRNQPIMLPDPTPGSQTSPRVPSSWSPRGTFYHPVMTPYGVQLQLVQMPGGSVSPRSSTPRRNITPVRQSTPGRGTSIMHSSASKPRASMGISLGRTDNNDVNGPVFILAIHPHGPAGRKHNPTSTLEPMQELLSVDGWSVQGQTMASISSQCAGDVGTRAVLEVRAAPSQGGQIFRVEIQRAQTPFDLGAFRPPQQASVQQQQQPPPPQDRYHHPQQKLQSQQSSLRQSQQHQQPATTPKRNNTPIRNTTPVRRPESPGFSSELQQRVGQGVVGYTHYGMPIITAPRSPVFGSSQNLTIPARMQNGAGSPRAMTPQGMPQSPKMPHPQHSFASNAPQSPRLLGEFLQQEQMASMTQSLRSPRMIQASPQSPRMMPTFQNPHSPRLGAMMGAMQSMGERPNGYPNGSSQTAGWAPQFASRSGPRFF